MSDEEKVELSAAEAMSVLNWKKSKVYYWMSSGKFKTVQRIDGDKILLTQSDINRLKVNGDFEQTYESSEISEKVQNSSVQNITENYKNVQNSLTSETFEFFNKSLETIKQIHQSSLQNYGYSLKLLTDGQSSIEKENLQLRQEKKAVEEQFEKVQREKNIIISILVFIILTACFIFFLVQNKFILL